MHVKIGSTAPGFESWSIELDVADNTTVAKLKALLAAPPHGLEITPKNKVLWKRANNCLMGLLDTEKVRGNLVLLNLTPSVKTMKFPDNFLWGSSTAAYQIEGAAAEGGRMPSIWDTFAEIPGNVTNDETGAVACDHYHKFREDVKLMKEMGLSSYRFSISWSRLLPSGRGKANPEAVEFYGDLLDELLANKITPMVTLYHWDLPQTLEDEYQGWLGKQVVDDFEYYAWTCFEKFGDRVRYWCTLNEPWCAAVLGYANGEHAPGHKEAALTEPYIVAHHMILAHARAVKCYRSEFRAKQQGRLGMALNMDWKEPVSQSPADVAAQRRALDWQLGWFAEPIYKGHYPANMRARCGDRLPTFTEAEVKLVKGSADFFGLNHYSSDYVAPDMEAEPKGYWQDAEVKNSKDPSWPKTDIGWDIVPWGLGKLVSWIHKEYSPNGGIIITENGCCVDDEDDDNPTLEDTDRLEYYQMYLTQVHKAITEGVDVRGYFAWSFMDNFEWAHGFSKRFGLVRVNYDTQERAVRASGKFLGEVARDNTLTVRTKLVEASNYAPLGAREPLPVQDKKPKPLPVSQDPDLSPESALKMLEELSEGYMNPELQAGLEAACTRFMEDNNLTALSKARQALVFPIQEVVLPKYGFEGNAAGVHRFVMYFQKPEMNEHKEVMRYSGFTNFIVQEWPHIRAKQQAKLREQQQLAEALGFLQNTPTDTSHTLVQRSSNEPPSLGQEDVLHLLEELMFGLSAQPVQEELMWGALGSLHGEHERSIETFWRVRKAVEREALQRCGFSDMFAHVDDVVAHLGATSSTMRHVKVQRQVQAYWHILYDLPNASATMMLRAMKAHAAQDGYSTWEKAE